MKRQRQVLSLAVSSCVRKELKYPFFNRVRDAIFPVGFGNKLGNFLHRLNCIAHRHASARVVNHGQIVFLIAYRHDVFRFQAQFFCQHFYAIAFVHPAIENLQVIRRTFQDGVSLMRLLRQFCNRRIKQAGFINHHQFRETRGGIHLFYCAITYRNTGQAGFVNSEFADVFVWRIEVGFIKGLKMYAQFSRQLLDIQIIVKAQRHIRHDLAIFGLMNQCAIIADAVLSVSLQIKLLQITLNANERPAGR
ncbi:Hypothetical Protein PANA_0085 [Pantoea ananatis LMG 20103]|uniref:Uncharacterized protein n=1 Tax=Pantoea ananatis (strain LMG 20103) TaxID=706191 RepID=D4GFY8_PANAM|nr:Hypothetical Protein PANA_0085 [Pantoea ananatis LMG 20103]